MNSSRLAQLPRLFLLCASLALFSSTATAQRSSLQFHRPGHSAGNANNSEVSQQFRSPSRTSETRSGTERARKQQPVAQLQAKHMARKVSTDSQVRQASTNVKQPARFSPPLSTNNGVHTAQGEDVTYDTGAESLELPNLSADCPHCMQDGSFGGDGCICDPPYGVCDPGCGVCDPGCGVCDPGCGVCDPGCGVCDPGCGVCDPGCGVCDPGCGVCDPGCGCPTPSCGSCVGIPGPDYWCVPVCFPRFKDLTFWGGVQGFRGPRDFIPNGRSDSNFGFHEGVNVAGRAPLVSGLFPGLSYQLGFQAFQSRLSGTVDTIDDRSQQFMTAGLFRRVTSGLQFGAVWDLMNDTLGEDLDLHQVRYEISLKSPHGREIGFWGATATNDGLSSGVDYEAVDQYAAFFRWNLYDGYQARVWGGGTGDSEGILGADFYAPLNDRWSVQSGFNYLIPQEDTAPAAVRQESWNIGINLVWHIGCSAKKGAYSPFRPLFAVADNGWMFVDRK